MSDGIIDSMDMSLKKLREILKDREVRPATVHRVTKSQTGLNNNNKFLLPGWRLCCLGCLGSLEQAPERSPPPPQGSQAVSFPQRAKEAEHHFFFLNYNDLPLITVTPFPGEFSTTHK